MFYLLAHEDVGPDERDSRGNYKSNARTLEISTAPGRKNMSGEICTQGWLGQTNDISSSAHGEFRTITAARNAAKKILGRDAVRVTSRSEDVDGYIPETVVEEWGEPEANMEDWDAGEWLSLASLDKSDFPGMTASQIVKKLRDEARAENVVLHGLDEWVEEMLAS